MNSFAKTKNYIRADAEILVAFFKARQAHFSRTSRALKFALVTFTSFYAQGVDGD